MKAVRNVTPVPPGGKSAHSHCASPKSKSGCVQAAGPIHLPFQSSGRITPATNVAGRLQSVASPRSFHVRTRHTTRCEEAGGGGGHGTFTCASPAVLPNATPSISSS